MKWFKPIGAVCFIILLCMNPASALDSASQALSSWALSVAPSLLPFLIAVPALTCPEVNALLSHISGGLLHLFRLPRHSTGVLLIGLLSGSPGGAAALASMERSSCDPPGALLRAALMASGASPAFLLTGIAVGMLNTPSVGWLLLRSQVGSIMLCGLILRLFGRENIHLVQPAKHEHQNTVLSAMLTLLTVGGYMTLFSVLACQISQLLHPVLETPLLAVLELAAGCRALTDLPHAVPLVLPLISAAACFGGVSVYAQCMSFLKPLGIDPLEYGAGKLFQSAIAALLTFLQIEFPLSEINPEFLPLFCLCTLLFILALTMLFRRTASRYKKAAASDTASEAAA